MFGEIPEIKTIKNDNYYSRNHVYAYPCTYSHVENVDCLIDNGIIEEYIPYISFTENQIIICEDNEETN